MMNRSMIPLITQLILLVFLTPISQAQSGPSAVFQSNTPIGDCQWDVKIALTGFAPNSSVTVSNHYTELVCASGELFTGSWSGTYPTYTDSNGSLIIDYLHGGTGAYNYSFEDEFGNQTTLSFMTRTPGSPSTAIISASPSTAVVGSSVVLTIQVVDASGFPVADGTPVIVSATLGAVGGTSTTVNGIVHRTLMPFSLGTSTISVQGLNSIGDTTITVVPGPPVFASVTASPKSAIIGQGINLDISVIDALHYPVNGVIPVDISSNLGSVSPSSTTAVNGHATATLSSAQAGEVTLTISSDGDQLVVTGDTIEYLLPSPPITDLIAMPGNDAGTIDLRWTSPTVNDNQSSVATYDVRYANSEITTFGWELATQVEGEPAPQSAGSTEEMTVSGLTPGEKYYFMVRARDNAGNLGGLGNSPGTVATPSECESGQTGLNFCELEKGDVLFYFSKYSNFFEKAVTYWTHVAIVGDNHMIAEARGPGPDRPDEDQVARGSIFESFWWTGEWVHDWAVIRPNAANLTRYVAADYAQNKADQTDPYVLYNTNFLNKDTEDKFYCSQLAWKAYEKLGLDLETDRGWVSPIVSPDDLYYSAGTNKSHLTQQQSGNTELRERAIFALHSPANLLLIDGQNRRSGFDADSQQTVNEIPEVYYSGPDEEPEYLAVHATDDMSDWQLIVTGTGVGTYTLDVQIVDPITPTLQIITDTTSPGQVDEFVVESSDTDDEEIIIKRKSSVFLPIILK